VTHDQEEALTMSDRIAVFSHGRIDQIGTPVEVYEHPATEFVAGFVGVSNLLERGGRRFTVRPEKIRMLAEGEAPAPGDESERGTVSDVVYVGSVTRYEVDLDAGGTLTVIRQNAEGMSGRELGGERRAVVLAWRPESTFTISHSEKEGSA
jgi:putative spermidine/putrescine transport system ATP-binding protein